MIVYMYSIINIYIIYYIYDNYNYFNIIYYIYDNKYKHIILNNDNNIILYVQLYTNIQFMICNILYTILTNTNIYVYYIINNYYVTYYLIIHIPLFNII